MPVDLVNRLQKSKLQAMNEFIDRSSNCVGGDDADDQTAATADYLVDEGIGLRQGLMRYWDYSWGLALAGNVQDRAQEGAEIQTLLNRGADCLARTADLARKGAEASGREVARLAQFDEQVRTFPLWIKECMARWQMLDRPRKPLNPERIGTAQTAYTSGEGEAVADVIARLKQMGKNRASSATSWRLSMAT